MGSDRPRLSRGDIALDAAATIRSRPGRALALGLAVVLGVATYVGISSMSASANRRVAERVDRLRPELVNVAPTRDAADAPRQYAGLTPAALDRSPQVRASAVAVRYPAVPVRARLSALPAKASVIGAEGDLIRATRSTLDGASLPGRGPAARSHVALVGAGVAAELDLADPAAAPTIWVDGIGFRVTGVITDSTYAAELVDAVVIPRSIATGLFGGLGTSTNGYVRTDRGSAPQVADALPLQLSPQAPESWSVQVPQVPIDVSEGISADLRNLTLAMSALVMAIGVVAIANAMMRSVYERISEIGLRRSLGARAVHILLLLVIEAALIGMAAGALGVVLGLVAAAFVAGHNGWPVVPDLASMVLALPGATAAGALAGLVPGLSAVRVTPSQALRRD